MSHEITACCWVYLHGWIALHHPLHMLVTWEFLWQILSQSICLSFCFKHILCCKRNGVVWCSRKSSRSPLSSISTKCWRRFCKNTNLLATHIDVMGQCVMDRSVEVWDSQYNMLYLSAAIPIDPVIMAIVLFCYYHCHFHIDTTVKSRCMSRGFFYVVLDYIPNGFRDEFTKWDALFMLKKNAAYLNWSKHWSIDPHH